MKISGLRNYIGVFSFTLFRYLEIVITGLTMLFLAKKIGPTEMGKTIGPLLYITYSSYLALGLNTQIVKNFKNFQDESEKVSFLTVNIQYFILISLVNLLLSYLLLERAYFFYTAIISIATLFRSFFTAYFRVVDKIWVLNINNIVLATSLLIGVLFFVEVWLDYLVIWSGVALSCVVLFMMYDLKMLKSVMKRILKKPDNIILKHSLFEGIKQAVVGAITTLLMTSDRFILNQLNITDHIKGQYQFADNISMMLYIGLTSILFYYTPNWIQRIKSDKLFIMKLNRIINYGLISILPLLAIAYISSLILKNLYYSEYDILEWYVVPTLLVKILLVINAIGVLIYTGLNREKDYVRSMIIPIVIIVSCGFASTYFINKSNIIIVPAYISLVLLCSIMIRKRVGLIA